MNFRHNVQCNVCEEYFIIKAQGGFVEKANVRLGCPKCKSLIKGEIVQKAPNFILTLKNATLKNELPSDDVEIFSVSTELPIIKSLANMRNTAGMSLSPYMALSSIIPLETITLFKNNYLEFKDFRDNKFNSLELIVELFQNEQWRYVLAESKKNFIPDLKTGMPENMEYCCYLIGEIIKQFVNKIIPPNYEYAIPIRLLHRDTLTKVQHDRRKLSEIKQRVAEYVDLEKEIRNAFQVILNFLKNIESYLPVIALSYGQGFSATFSSDYAITTFSFDELKDKFKDCFELLARTSLIYVSFSNFNRNGDCNDFSGLGSCPDLAAYYKTSNGNKKAIIDKIPRISEYYRNLLDSQIRNSIGHNKTEYFTVEQIIKYYPYSDIKKKDESKEISLVDFAYKTLLLNIMTLDFIFFTGKWNYRIM